jgi:hypothetical protein
MRAIPSHAEAQFGVFTHEQACEQGWNLSALKRAAHRGDLCRLRRGVYALPLEEDQPDWRRRRTELIQRAAAATLMIPTGHASHAAAIALHDLPLLDVPSEPCLTLPSGFRIVERDVHLHRIREPDWHRLGNVAVSRPARACLELSKEQGLTSAVVAADAAAHRGLVTPDSPRETYRSMRGRGGAPVAQQVMELMDGRSESALESLSRLVLPYWVPKPTLQAKLVSNYGAYLGRVDFYWEELGVVGEVDGRLKYESGEEPVDAQALWKEKQRADRMGDFGGVVVRWGWLEARQPHLLDQKLWRAFSRARHLREAGIPLLLTPRYAHTRAA